MVATSAIGMSDGYLPAAQVLSMLEEDFESAWNALAAQPLERAGGRGNFVFAQQAMVALELTCRVAHADPHRAVLPDFARLLRDMDPRYFTRIPGSVPAPKSFRLPQQETVPANETLLALLFDLIRNGQAHQYHQIPARMDDGRLLFIALGGVEVGQRYEATPPGRRKKHLRCARLPRSRNLRLVVLPEVLFRDFRLAARAVFSHGIEPVWLGRNYPFGADALAAALGCDA